MLDRLPTEPLRLVVQQISPSVWERKECITNLGLVCGRLRRAVKAIADEYVHVDRAGAVDIIKRWPSTSRRAVTTLLIGHDGSSTESKGELQLEERDLNRLLSSLPATKQVYVRHLEGNRLPEENAGPEPVSFTTAESNPFRSMYKAVCCALVRVRADSLPPPSERTECTSLSIRDSYVYFESSLEQVKFSLKHLHISSLQQEPQNAPGSGLEQQVLTRKALPKLETLRLSCHWLPRCSKDFLDQLRLIQVDLKADNVGWILEAMRPGFLATKTPLLLAYDESLIAQVPSPKIPGVKYIRLETGYPHNVLNTLKALPDLEAVFFAGEFNYRTGFLGDIDRSGQTEVREYFGSSNLVVLRPQEGDCDFVEAAFSRYVRSRA
ncbi:hypothetical protein JCM10908_000917 [Rhodotorula pacifica]|uniref:uncharacterized protein n=1 Tax=Rhodotorula pacifica TaxID=1495444 RepID=UPI00317F292A